MTKTIGDKVEECYLLRAFDFRESLKGGLGIAQGDSRERHK